MLPPQLGTIQHLLSEQKRKNEKNAFQDQTLS